ncbi:MAG: Txe/YoeB family addiction module toxin [Ignavibacteriales bacterium]
MKLVWASNAWEDYLHWQQTDIKTLQRVNDLIKECMRDPFRDTGKPEPLKEHLQGWWSRRINGSDRLVYRVRGKEPDQVLEIIQCRLHY